MKIERQSALRRLAVALVATLITAATFGAIGAAVVPPSSGIAALNATAGSAGSADLARLDPWRGARESATAAAPAAWPATMTGSRRARDL